MIVQTSTQPDEERLRDLRARSYYNNGDIEDLCLRLENALDYQAELEDSGRKEQEAHEDEVNELEQRAEYLEQQLEMRENEVAALEENVRELEAALAEEKAR